MRFKTLFLAPAALLGLSFTSGLQAQDDASKKGNPQPEVVTVTGCLARTETPGVAKQFVIKAADMSYPLEAPDQDLTAHLGHKVTVSGTSMKGKGPHDEDRIRVTKVTMVSTTCLK